ncbi:hypothetical protein [Arthrobacter sp. zg-Y179]|uniref:hypothetical protein n=1 Tax=Arthrobacter sp. zg-Y179 TaxID=2894188 RepID=UPI001E34FB51|nr:hypothetical protein [Arthrobacter sp. zg-Y179]MCC9175096.1 hypothetical protein [Arthrobacter sp. zg-Y179]
MTNDGKASGKRVAGAARTVSLVEPTPEVPDGVDMVTPPETEPWGERFAQYRDPNGLIVQIVQWITGE